MITSHGLILVRQNLSSLSFPMTIIPLSRFWIEEIDSARILIYLRLLVDFRKMQDIKRQILHHHLV